MIRLAAFQPVDFSETVDADWSAFKRWRRRALSAVYCLPDRGWFGLQPLRDHVLICGFPRSGTSLLQIMLENALPTARRFGREISGWRAATYTWRNHATVISKNPYDIFKLHRVQNLYRNRAARLHPIVTYRDPRDVLCSRHPHLGVGSYFMEVRELREFMKLLRIYRRHEEVLMLNYESLVADPHGVESRIAAFTGMAFDRPLAEYIQEARPDFDTRTLNGLRPIDRASIGQWKQDVHRARVAEVLNDADEVADWLIELGYETSTDWIGAWRASSGPRERLTFSKPSISRLPSSRVA